MNNSSNLDLFRATHALEKAKSLRKESVNRLPGLIIANGLLATLAFVSEEKDEREPLRNAMDAVAHYLLKRKIITAKDNNKSLAEQMLEDLTKSPSSKLQQATYETLKYLSYLKRFAKKKI
ncbi:hypothetical protein A946_02040 [Methylacidiphilum kamchatkense Kam1]|uniref:CRISPR type III-B/RAMP module-associated protein Cmr5 n=1 Tax=Methylacidiphilum kamchatkense Kam1 TaxID=1202785 RepID=A0A0C1UUQ6_9BACT|nr:type III-B CRISPR module-associated protein Cmr5 [Methylacidiphilum kamchatkense]KIE59473.1 hypothetical protein A946_02040 [Methylacidiphilum kamchatkense Kam1]QDQ42528.1 CRISPR type III-B/RAMP module-associated protein Cmr5 [Methylacidiphilum kamchatkense Kam1]